MPEVVLVSGAPASGKSVLASRLAAGLGRPLLSKDVFKEAIADALGVADVEESRRVGLAAVMVLYRSLFDLVGAGVSVVVESAFVSGRAEADLAALPGLAGVRVVHCRAPVGVLARRYAARAGSRHACHFDDVRAVAGMDWGAWGVLELPGVPVLAVDTREGYDPGYAVVEEFARGVVR